MRPGDTVLKWFRNLGQSRHIIVESHPYGFGNNDLKARCGRTIREREDGRWDEVTLRAATAYGGLSWTCLGCTDAQWSDEVKKANSKPASAGEREE